jgi:hypothetical protein
MKILLSIITFTLASCGLYLVERNDQISDVEVIINQDDESSFIIKKILNDKFNSSTNAPYRYRLLIEKTESVTGSAIQSDAFSATYILNISVSFKLINAQTNKVIFVNTITNKSNYLAGRNNPVADFSSQKTNSKNLSIIVADKIYNTIQERFSFTNENAKK